MHLIAYSKSLMVVCSVFFSMDSPQLILIKWWKEVHWHRQWYCSSPIFMRWSASWLQNSLSPQLVLMVCIFSTFIYIQSCIHIGSYPCFKGWWHENVLQVQHRFTFSLGGMHLFDIQLHSIWCPHQLMAMFKRLNPDKDALQVQHHSHLLLEFTRS